MSVVKRKPQAMAAQEAALLQCLRARGPLSRVDLARALDLVPSTVGSYVDRLLRDEFLVESPSAARGLGRPPVLVELNPARGRFLGIDIEAQNIHAIAIDFARRPVARRHRPLPTRVTTQRVLDVACELIEELREQQETEILGIGVGVPGPTDPDRGIGLYYNFIRDWRNVPIVEALAAQSGVPVALENNIRSLALAELSFGQGEGLRHVACLGIRSGIGLGIVVDGALFRGARNLAGEIGHWPAPAGTRGAAPGASIEAVASLSALRRDAIRHCGIEGSIDALFAAAARGDKGALDLIRRSADVHAWVAHQVVLLLDPDRVLVAGPLVERPEYLTWLQDACRRLGGKPLAGRVAASKLGAYGGALGAAALAVQQWKPER